MKETSLWINKKHEIPNDYILEAFKRLFIQANGLGLKGFKVENLEYEREESNGIDIKYARFKYKITQLTKEKITCDCDLDYTCDNCSQESEEYAKQMKWGYDRYHGYDQDGKLIDVRDKE